MLEAIFWMACGALVIMLLPPRYEDWLRQWILTGWQKLTNRS